MKMVFAAWLALAQATEPSRAGEWRDKDLGVVSRFTKGGDEHLTWRPETKVFTGKLIKPDDGQVVDVTLSVASPQRLEAEAGFFIFRKRLELTRVVEDGGSP